MVYECNSSCRCQENCENRILQKGVRVKLEVFKSRHKGWGVRAGEPIARGTFVCEYVGEVLNDQEANKRGER
jgi:SET domain-containing protein